MGERETAAAYARILHKQMKEALVGMAKDGYGREGAMMVIISTLARLMHEEGMAGWRRLMEMMNGPEDKAA